MDYRQIVESCFSAIFAVNCKGVIQLWTTACQQLFGVGQEICGQSVQQLSLQSLQSELPLTEPLTEPFTESLTDLVAQVFLGKSFDQVIVSYLLQNGNPQFLKLHLYPLKTVAEQIEYCVIECINITEQKLVEVRLQQLEQQVQERNLQLRRSLQFGELLKRITDRVRQSLDEQQILQNAVEEIAEALGTVVCDTGLYNLEQRTSTIFCEHLSFDMASAQGLTFEMEMQPEIYQPLLNGQYVQFCMIEMPAVTLRTYPRYLVVLVCPLIDDQGVIGDLWLYRSSDLPFDEAEIHLVQQVGNQCAIAIRQSRLYQAAAAQVDELARLNYLKDDFLSSVSHELRTPMANIKMATQMLEICLHRANALADSEFPAHRYFQILKDECQRELTLINNLLDLSRIDAGVEPLLLSTLNLKEWLEHQAEPFIERTRSQQQSLKLAIAPHLPVVTTDFLHLGRILAELLQNACKYTPAGGTIQLLAHLRSAPESGCQHQHHCQQPDQQSNQKNNQQSSQPINQQKDQQFNQKICQQPHQQNDQKPRELHRIHSETPWLQICVKNSGVEIPSTEQERVFERFYRIPSHDPWKHEGTGLGLALVRKLIAHLGGAIALTSAHGWTTFSLSLPQQINAPQNFPRALLEGVSQRNNRN